MNIGATFPLVAYECDEQCGYWHHRYKGTFHARVGLIPVPWWVYRWAYYLRSGVWPPTTKAVRKSIRAPVKVPHG